MGSVASTHRLRIIVLRLEFAYEFPSEIVVLHLHHPKHARHLDSKNRCEKAGRDPKIWDEYFYSEKFLGQSLSDHEGNTLLCYRWPSLGYLVYE